MTSPCVFPSAFFGVYEPIESDKSGMIVAGWMTPISIAGAYTKSGFIVDSLDRCAWVAWFNCLRP
ncbi:hypothetical protein AP057_08185 [Geobacillus sp. Sah69]|nr:hypothetical protein AP057_08185 [Geobacillus sp. Sah69]